MARVILENVRVDFPIYGAQHRSLRTAIMQRATGGLIYREGRNNERIIVRALNGVSLHLEEGDRLGLVGHNGSGKSTLLKVIAGIYEPITGTRKVEGRVTPLFDMMPGLEPEDSGYENILTSGILLGMSRDQVESKIPEIEEFCELGEYLALPVRTYSAGMLMRLGFALVTALEPGVLLMDEGFGTGDLRFTERATKRMEEFIGRSRIIILASHSDRMIKSMCDRAALLHEGQLVAVGPVDDIYERYEAMAHGNATPADSTPQRPVNGKHSARSVAVPIAESMPPRQVNSQQSDRPGAAPDEDPAPRPAYSEDSIRDIGLADRLTRATGAVRFIRAVARDESGQSRWTYAPGETVTFRFEYEVVEPVPNLELGFVLYRLTKENAWRIVTHICEVVSVGALEAGQSGAVELMLPRLALMPNRLLLNVRFVSIDGMHTYDIIDANVDLPHVMIGTGRNDSKLWGDFFVEYEFRKCDVQEAGSRASCELSLGCSTGSDRGS
jgi:ABC-type polysaccharide/polyol phosphate transport system ATPase subunit